MAGWVLLLGLVLPVVAEPVRTVLIVYGENRVLPGITIFDENFRSTVRERAGQPVEFLTEFLDTGRFSDEPYETALAGFLRDKYLGMKIDVVVAGGPTALKFLLRHRGEVLPRVPVVHAAVMPSQLKGLAPPPDVVGVPTDFDPLPTLELALRLHPKVRRLVLATGTSAWDRDWEKLLRELIPRMSKGVQVEFLAGLPMTELEARLRSLPGDSVVFVPSFFRDGAGQSFVVREAVARIAAAAAVPVYGPSDTYLGTGIVGGYMPTFKAIGRQAGEIALRLLNGETPSALRLPDLQRSDYLLDWRQLRRWGVDAKALPEGTILKFREPTFWEAHRRRILGAAAIVLLQTVLIIVLMLERRSRRLASAKLRESEQRVNLASDAAGVGLWLWDSARDEIWATPKTRALYGIGASEPVDLDRFLRTLHPEDRGPMKKAVGDALATGNNFELQHRVVLGEGDVRWISARGQMESGTSGQPRSIIGASIDITARKSAKLAAERHRNELAYMARVALLGQLSGAIAHELNQPLTAILSNAQAALRLLAREPADLVEIRDICTDIVEEDQRAVEVIRRLRSLFNRGAFQCRPLDLSEVAQEVLSLVHSDLVTRRVTLVVELADKLPVVSGDRVQLQQVLLNLIANACEAMMKNELPERRLAFRTERGNGGEVVAAVTDSGPGVDPAVVDRLFEPFFTTKPQGMGMGLAISRSIVEAHGGWLTVSNNEGPGATFRVSLPAGEGFGR